MKSLVYVFRQLVESFAGSGKPTQDMQVVQEVRKEGEQVSYWGGGGGGGGTLLSH